MNFNSLEGFETLGPNVTLDPRETDVEEVLRKAYVPGQGIVQAGESTAAALRAQVLDPLLVASLYQTQDARFLQLLYSLAPLRADSVAYEYTNMERYGDDREAFLQDIGAAASTYSVIADQINTADDVYQRYVKNARFLGTRRIVSLTAALSRAIVNPVAAAMVGATNEIIGKANAALYWGDPSKNALHWEGLDFQIMNAYFSNQMTASSVNPTTLTPGSADSRIAILNAGGKSLADTSTIIANQQLAEPLIQEAAARIAENFGEAQAVLVSPRIMQTISASLLAKERIIPSMQNGIAGVYTNILVSSDGMPLQLVVDRLMQPGRSLIPHRPLALSTDMDTIPTASTNISIASPSASAINAATATRLAKWLSGSWNNMSAVPANSFAPEVDPTEAFSFAGLTGTNNVYVGYHLYVVDGSGRVVASQKGVVASIANASAGAPTSS